MKERFAVWLLAIALAACGGGPADPPGRGKVVAVDAAKGEITLEHGDIPGLMKGMTMTFQADPALLAGIEAGQEVDFRAREEAGRYQVTALEPLR